MDDEHQMVDMDARQYMPWLKHFASADTIVATPLYGPSWNRYSDVLNNPLNHTDPSGQAASEVAVDEKTFWAIFGAAMDAGGTLSGFVHGLPDARLSSDGRILVKVEDKSF